MSAAAQAPARGPTCTGETWWVQTQGLPWVEARVVRYVAPDPGSVRPSAGGFNPTDDLAHRGGWSVQIPGQYHIAAVVDQKSTVWSRTRPEGA